MRRDEDFTTQLARYLEEYEGSTPLPAHVRDAIRAQLPSIQQRPAWWPGRRFPEMNSMAKLGLAAVAAAVAALLGINFLVAPSIGDPDATPTPIPPPLQQAVSIDPGTYTLVGEGLNATMTVPAGWRNLGQRGVTKGSDESFMAVTFWPYPADLAVVYTDPCNWATNLVEPPVGSTVDELADALAAQAMRGDAIPSSVTIDGYEGKYLEMTVPLDIDFASCDSGQFRSWAGRFHQGPGQVDHVYILDVDGEREVIVVHHMPGASEADLAEQQRVFESIDIAP